MFLINAFLISYFIDTGCPEQCASAYLGREKWQEEKRWGMVQFANTIVTKTAIAMTAMTRLQTVQDVRKFWK